MTMKTRYIKKIKQISKYIIKGIHRHSNVATDSFVNMIFLDVNFRFV